MTLLASILLSLMWRWRVGDTFRGLRVSNERRWEETEQADRDPQMPFWGGGGGQGWVRVVTSAGIQSNSQIFLSVKHTNHTKKCHHHQHWLCKHRHKHLVKDVNGDRDYSGYFCERVFQSTLYPSDLFLCVNNNKGHNGWNGLYVRYLFCSC